ncbi:MAG: hypothetical protein WD473_12950 [Acidimicrobiia bacterium]
MFSLRAESTRAALPATITVSVTASVRATCPPPPFGALPPTLTSLAGGERSWRVHEVGRRFERIHIRLGHRVGQVQLDPGFDGQTLGRLGQLTDKGYNALSLHSTLGYLQREGGPMAC